MTILPQLEERLTSAARASQTRTQQRPSRRRRARRVVLVLGATLAVSATALAATQPWTGLDEAVDHGQRPPAPDRSLPVVGTPGTESLAQYRGKIVVMTFFADWCDPCRNQAPLLDQVSKSLAADGTGTALLVSWNERSEDAQRFVAGQRLSMPVLADDRGLLARDYDVQALPATFVIDPAGRVVAISRKLATQQFLDGAIAKAKQPGPDEN